MRLFNLFPIQRNAEALHGEARRKSKFMFVLRWPPAICLMTARFPAKGHRF